MAAAVKAEPKAEPAPAKKEEEDDGIPKIVDYDPVPMDESESTRGIYQQFINSQ